MQIVPADGDSADLVDRDFDCSKMSWVAYWLNLVLQERLISMKHVLVQAIIAMLYFLLMPRFYEWSSLPALSTFASILLYISKGKVYHLTRGKGMFGKGNEKESIVQIVKIDFTPSAEGLGMDFATLHVTRKPWLQKVLRAGTILLVDPKLKSGLDWGEATFEVESLTMPDVGANGDGIILLCHMTGLWFLFLFLFLFSRSEARRHPLGMAGPNRGVRTQR